MTTFIQIQSEYYNLLPLPLVGATLWKAHKSDSRKVKVVDRTLQPSLRLYRKVLLYLSVDCSPSCQRRPRMSLTKYCQYIGPHNPFFSPTDRSFRAAALLKILSDFHRSPSPIYEILIIPLIIPNFWRISCLTQNTLHDSNFLKNLIQL